MKVSVIIPVHNAEAYLQESVDSVLMQTCDDMEILLIDDASEDRSADICEAHMCSPKCARSNTGFASFANHSPW